MKAMIKSVVCGLVASSTVAFVAGHLVSQTQANDHLRELQKRAVQTGQSDVGHWGWTEDQYSQWTTHTNRLIPVYTFGTRGAGKRIDLADYITRWPAMVVGGRWDATRLLDKSCPCSGEE